MLHWLLDYIHRHEPKGETVVLLKSGLGAIVGMTLVGAMASITGLPMLLAPFGATAVLLFGQAQSPLAQPANIFGGYFVAVLLTVLLFSVLPQAWWVATLTCGLSVAVMLLLRVTHPPAGAIPLVALGSTLPLFELLGCVLAGSICLVLVGVIHHRLVPPRVAYPRRRT